MNKPFYVIALAMIAFGCSQIRSDANDTALLEEAKSAYNAGEWQEAIDLATTVAETNPDIPKAWNIIGNSYYHLGDYEQALTGYERTAELLPENEVAWNNVGLAHAKLDESYLAEKAYIQSIVLNHTYASAWNNLGILYLYEGHSAEAANCFSNYLNIETNEIVLYNYGLALYYSDQYFPAAKAFIAAWEINPDEAGYTKKAAESLREYGWNEEAIEYYQLTLERIDDDPDIWVGLGLCYMNLDQPDEAEQNFNRALELDPTHEDALYYRYMNLYSFDPMERLTNRSR